MLEAGTPGSLTVLFSVVRALDFLLLLLVGGGTLMLVAGLAGTVRARPAVLLAGSAFALAVVAVAGVVLQGAAAGGFALGEALHRDVVTAVIETRFGEVWLAQAILAVATGAVLLLGVRAPRLVPAAVVPAALLLLTPSASGHASVSGRLAFVADVAHVVAAAVWVGGLTVLVLALLWAARSGGSWRSPPCRASRFSRSGPSRYCW